ncbi:MAG: hypothetical protein R3199_07585 [Gemmatimonadota bacterium]|nr:hypothetical protein [Gemmatimonadota bacterium]
MKVVTERIVPLGYGKYARSDRVVALVPIEEDRGPGRRTRVHVEGLADPIVASRSDGAILGDLVEPSEGVPRAEEQRQLLLDILDTLEGLDPMLRRIVRDQSDWNLDRLEERIRDVLGEEPA